MIHTSRRSFMSSTVAASAMTAFPFIRTAQGASANEKVNLACVGIGNQGGKDINDLYNTGLCNIVALCDTEIGDTSPKARVAANLKKFPKAAQFTDFRKMFDKMTRRSTLSSWERRIIRTFRFA